MKVSLLRVVLTAVGPAAAGTAVASSRICPGEVWNVPSATLLHQRMLESFKSKQEIMFHGRWWSICMRQRKRAVSSYQKLAAPLPSSNPDGCTFPCTAESSCTYCWCRRVIMTPRLRGHNCYLEVISLVTRNLKWLLQGQKHCIYREFISVSAVQYLHWIVMSKST